MKAYIIIHTHRYGTDVHRVKTNMEIPDYISYWESGGYEELIKTLGIILVPRDALSVFSEPEQKVW